MRFMTKGSTMLRHARRNSALGSRKQKLTHACRQVLIDQLESRVLLSTGGMPDPGFGQGGYIKGYQVLAVQQDGSLVAVKGNTSKPNPMAIFHPDGSFEAAGGHMPSDAGTPINVLPGGDFLVERGGSWVSGNTVTCYKPTAPSTVETSFGNNGTVSDFTSGTGYPPGAFNPEGLIVAGNQIIVSGGLNLNDGQNDFVTALVRLNQDGSIDHSFGVNGIAKGADEGAINNLKIYDTYRGPNGNYFVAGEFNGRPLVTEFSPAGTYVSSAHLSNSGGDYVDGLDFSRNKVYMLANWTYTTDAVAAFDLNLKPDTGFGNNGVVVVLPPDHSPNDAPDGSGPAFMKVDPNGTILVSTTVGYLDGSGGDYTIAYLPDWGANTSVSGFIYNDANANGKMDSGETPIRYAQAFVDLNGNGVFDKYEPTAYTDYNGYYKIHGLDPGTYKVYEVVPSIWKEASSPAYHTFTVNSGQVSTGNDFGNYLYGAHGGDPWFGENAAVVGYTAQQVLPDGVIVARNSAGNLVGLNPDGSVDSAFNPATDIPPAPLPGIYQSDGKRLVLNTSTETITRYNTDGSVDQTFGNNGSVSSFPQTPHYYLFDNYWPPGHYSNTTFTPKFIAMQGNDIIVAGALNGEGESGPIPTQLAVERLYSDGSEDTEFGLVGYLATTYDSVTWQGLFVANEGQIYVVGTDTRLTVWAVLISANLSYGSQTFVGDANRSAAGMAMGPDGRLVIVTDEGPGYYNEITRLNPDLTPDPQLNGYVVSVDPSFNIFGKSTYVVGGPFISADGKVLLDVTYTQNQQTTDLLIRLPAEVPSGSGSISGYIYNDANANGVHDSGDSPIRYAQAFVDLNGNGKFDLGEPTAYADYNGYYKIYGVAPGTYRVYEVLQTGYTQDAPSATRYRTVTVTAGNTATGADFGNVNRVTPQPGSISGTFFYDSNHNGVWDSGEPISPYWGVYIDANNDGKYDSGDTELIANGKGQFTFPNLAAGTYVIRGTTASGWTQTFPANGGAQVITLAAGQNVNNINFGEYHGIIPATGSISGIFFNDGNANGQKDSGETPLTGWQAFVDLNGNGIYDAGEPTAYSDSNGYYKIDGIAPGTYNVYEVPQPGWGLTTPTPPAPYHTFMVSSGQVSTGNDFGNRVQTFNQPGSVYGYIAKRVLLNGIIVAQDLSGKTVGLYPDGTLDASFNPATDIPPAPLPGLYLSDGKRLVLDTKNSTLTRYNADGSIDYTFGTNGTFSGFAQTPTRYIGANDPTFAPFQGTTFIPQMIALQGGNIVVSGQMSGTYENGGSFFNQLAVERITSNGLQDYGFGVVACLTPYYSNVNNVTGLYIANSGQIDIEVNDIEEYAWEVQLSSDGTTGNIVKDPFDVIIDSVQRSDGSIVVWGWIDGIHPEGVDVLPFDEYSLIPTFDSTQDWFGDEGILTGPDGSVYLSLDYMRNSQRLGTYLVSLSGSGNAISGHIYNDTNGNGAFDSGEPPLPYAQAFIDINGNGKFDLGEPTGYADSNGYYHLGDVPTGYPDYNAYYQLGDVPPGTYKVYEVTPAGYSQDAPSATPYRTVTITAGNTVTGIDFGNVKGTAPQSGSISGTFFYDSNTNGTWDTGEAPSPYWGVYIDANNDGEYDTGDTELIANGAGQFTFKNLAPGTYIVRGTTASGWTQTFPANGGAQTVTVGSGQAVTGVNFGEFHGTVSAAKGSISGTFFYDSNHNGVWDSGEPISPYWGVYIDANNDGKFDSGDTELIANGKGQFTFPNLPAGTYVIRGTTASGWTQTFPANGGAQVVTITAGQNLSNVNFGEYHGVISSAKGSISGTFFYDSNANGIWDSGETYSPSWGVYIDANNDGVYDTGDTELIATAHGQYTFSNLSAGTYVIRATTASGWKQTYPANGGAQVITLVSGQNAAGVNFGKVRT